MMTADVKTSSRGSGAPARPRRPPGRAGSLAILHDGRHRRLASDDVAGPLGHERAGDSGAPARRGRGGRGSRPCERPMPRTVSPWMVTGIGTLAPGLAFLALATASSTYAFMPSLVGETGTRSPSTAMTSGDRTAIRTAARAAAGVRPPTWTPPIETRRARRAGASAPARASASASWSAEGWRGGRGRRSRRRRRGRSSSSSSRSTPRAAAARPAPTRRESRRRRGSAEERLRRPYARAQV